MCGQFNSIATLSSVGLHVTRNRFITVVNTSNSNGAALVGVLAYLSATARKRIFLSNASTTTLSRRKHHHFHTRGVNLMFRRFRLVPFLATLRGVVLTRRCRDIISRTTTEGILRRMKLKRHIARLPDRLSNNRRRHIYVTQTLIGRPPIVFTSRPANGLSRRGRRQILSLLASLRHRKHAVIVIARGPTLKRFTSHVLQLRRNGCLNRRTGRRTLTWYTIAHNNSPSGQIWEEGTNNQNANPNTNNI